MWSLYADLRLEGYDDKKEDKIELGKRIADRKKPQITVEEEKKEEEASVIGDIVQHETEEVAEEIEFPDLIDKVVSDLEAKKFDDLAKNKVNAYQFGSKKTKEYIQINFKI